MLVTIGWGWVIVLAQFVTDAMYGGVSEARMGSVVVGELGCAAVTPWRTFDVARVWRGNIGARDDGMLRGQNRLELVAVLRGRLCTVVSYGGCVFVLFEDGLEDGSCVSKKCVAGWCCWGGRVGVWVPS